MNEDLDLGVAQEFPSEVGRWGSRAMLHDRFASKKPRSKAPKINFIRVLRDDVEKIHCRIVTSTHVLRRKSSRRPQSTGLWASSSSQAVTTTGTTTEAPQLSNHLVMSAASAAAIVQKGIGTGMMNGKRGRGSTLVVFEPYMRSDVANSYGFRHGDAHSDRWQGQAS